MTVKKQIPRYKLLTINGAGLLGYSTCVLQGLWLGVLFLPPILENEQVKLFIIPEPSTAEAPRLPEFQGSDVLIMLIAIVVTILVLGITLIILAKLPMKFVAASKYAVDTSAEKVIPLVTHHKTITKTERRSLSIRIRVGIKLLLCILPAALLFFVYIISLQLDTTIIFVVGVTLLVLSLFWFSLEYLLARALHVPLEKIA